MNLVESQILKQSKYILNEPNTINQLKGSVKELRRQLERSENRIKMQSSQKYWLIQNEHLKNVIKQKELKIQNLTEEIQSMKEVTDQLQCLQELKQNNEQLMKEIDNHEKIMLKVLEEKEQLFQKIRINVEKQKQYQNTILELRNQITVLQQRISYYEKQCDQQEGKALFPAINIGQFVKKLDQRLKTTTTNGSNCDEKITKIMIAQENEIYHYRQEIKQYEELIQILKKQKQETENQMDSLRNELDQMMKVIERNEKKEKLQKMEKKIYQNYLDISKNKSKVRLNKNLEMDERELYEEKLQSKKELINLLNQKIKKLEESLLSMTHKYENIHKYLVEKESGQVELN